MERNLYILNMVPFRPTRFCTKIGLAPGLSTQITTAKISIGAASTVSPSRDRTTSRTRCARR